MKNCINCNKEIQLDQEFCQHCGATQKIAATTQITQPKSVSPFLLILCILTILGSIFGLGRALLYELVATAADNNEYIRGWIFMITSVGTLTGAVLMLQKKKLGLQIYTVSQGLYITTVVFTTMIYSEFMDGAESIAFVVSMIFLVPSILFLVLYWLDTNRSQLVN